MTLATRFKKSSTLADGAEDCAEMKQSMSHIHDEERRIGLSPKEQNHLRRRTVLSQPGTHILKVAVIGAPNAGKSTLTNKIIGWKIAPVSEKVHTTRCKTLGVLTEENKQVIFLDTPGIIVPGKLKKHKLETSLLVDPHLAVNEADLIAVVVDVSNVWHRTRLEPEILKVLNMHSDKKSILVMNKVDLVKNKRELLCIGRSLTEGIVDGRKSWTTPKQNQAPKLENLFRKMKQHAKMELEDQTFDGSHSKEFDDADEVLEIKEKDGTTSTTVTMCKSLRFLKEEDSDEEGLHDEEERIVVRDESHGSISDSSDNPNLRDKTLWKTYYRNMQRIGQSLENKTGWPNFNDVFMISALSGDGVYDLKEFLMNNTYVAPWKYHSSFITDQNPITLARCCIFEKLLDHLPEEIPYQIKVKMSLWEVTEDDLLRVSFDLICSRKRHLHFIFGKDGQTIRRIASEAKQELMNAFRRELSFQLIVRGSSNIYHKKQE